ncbi:MAG: CPBP family intramembrane metalloprotease [Phycisphaerales bacterium]|nr:CPBP family intramembrane metalloprotease [Phycisphaerales bacterium]
MTPFSCAYAVAMVAVLILFFVYFIRNRAEIRRFTRASFVLGAVAVLIDMAYLGWAGDSLQLNQDFLVQVFVIDLMLLAKITLFAAVGIYCCKALGLPSAPLVLGVFRPGPAQAPAAEELAVEATDEFAVHEIALTDDPLNADAVVEPKQQNWGAAVAWALAVATGGVAFSYLLFALTKPALSEMLQELLETSEASLNQLGIAMNPTFESIMIVCAFAYGEEILFRLGIQNYLAKTMDLGRSRYWISICITAAIWSLAHANTLDPEWVKFAQILPIGVALGYLFRRFGLEACILAHGAFNVAMVFLAPYMIDA